jgi:uncharacterized protein (DUF433 family)
MRRTVGEAKLIDKGLYTIPEVAMLVGAPQPNVRVWIEGHAGKQEPLIFNQLGRVDGKTVVSFANLIEMRFIKRFASAGVKMRDIRRIMEEVSDILEHPHPFATKSIFRTDGRKIVADIARKNGLHLIYDLKSRNYEMPTVVMKSLLEDVVFDPEGEAMSWKPRPAIAPNVIVHPKYSFGRPVIESGHIPTATLSKAVKVEGGSNVVSLMFEVPEKQVKQAVVFERELRKAA